MPPKRKYQRDGTTPLPQIEGLQTMGKLDPLIRGVIFGLVFAGRSYEDVAQCTHTSIQTVSRTVKEVAEAFDAAELLRPRPAQPRAATPPAADQPEEPATAVKAISASENRLPAPENRTLGDLVHHETYRKRTNGEYENNTCREIRKAVLQRYDVAVSVRTIQRYVKDQGVRYVRRPYTSPLTPERMLKRVEVANEILLMFKKNPELAAKLVFTDECILRAEDNGIHCMVRPGEKPTPRRQARWAATVHVWGAIGVGFRQLVFLDGMVDADDYQDTLNRFLINPKSTTFVEEERVLMQDGARPHTAKATMAFLESHGVGVLPWASYSPDWNPIENLWSILKRRMTTTCFDTKEDLEEAVNEAWHSIPQETLDRLAISFPGRLAKTIEVEGEDCQL